VPYDVLSVNVGSSPTKMSWSDDAAVTPVKPIDGFGARWEVILARVLAAATTDTDGGSGGGGGGGGRKAVEVLVVGAGAGGVELCLSIQHRLDTELKKRGRDPAGLVRFTLLGRSPGVCPAHNAQVQALFKSILESRKVRLGLGADGEVVDVRTNTAAAAAGVGVGVDGAGKGGAVQVKSGKTYEFDECIWCTQVGDEAEADEADEADPWPRSCCCCELQLQGQV
jgi:selenide,water dikinase